MLLAPLLLALADLHRSVVAPPRVQEPVVEIQVLVELPPAWTPGLKRTLEFVKERQDEQRGKLGPKNVATTTIDFEVTAKDDTGFTTNWTYRTTKVEAGNPIASIVATKVASSYEGWVMRLHHGLDGSIEAFVDEDEARTKLFSLMDGVVATMAAQPGAKPKDVETMRTALSAAKSMLDGPAFAASTLKDPQMIFIWCGASLVVGEKREYDDQLPNPFGGDPFPAHASIEVVRHDADKAEVELEWHQTLDKEKASAAIAAMLRELAVKVGKPLPADQELPLLDIVDEGRWTFDTRLGLPTNVVWTRTIKNDELVRRETLRATLRPVDAK